MAQVTTSNALAAVAEYAAAKDSDFALAALVRTAQQVVGYQTALMSQIDREQSLLRIHEVLNTDPSALTVPPGLQIPMTASPCQHVASSTRPFTASDMLNDPELMLLPAAKDMGATAYLGVPVTLSDGTFFGTLAALDTKPQQPSDEHVQWFQVLARFAAAEVERQGVKQLVAS